MSFNQIEIMKRAQTLGFFIDEKGLCFGISHMFMQAVMSNDIDNLLERFNLILDIPVSEFKQTFDNKIYNALKEKDNDTLQRFYSLYAFFSGCVLYQSPEMYQRLFSRKKLYHQKEIPALTLVNSVYLEKEREAPYQILNTLGNYDDKELRIYLKSLRSYLDKTPLHFILSSSSHFIYLYYSPKNKQWCLSDPNYLPGKHYRIKDEDALADALKKHLLGDKTTLIDSTLYVKQSETKMLEKPLTQLKKDSDWQAIHTLDKPHINEVNLDNITLFYMACENGDITLLRKLLKIEKGHQQITKMNKAGITPLWIACRNGHIDIVKLLLEIQNTNINQADNYGNTPLWVACTIGHSEIVKWLLNYEHCKINQENKLGASPILSACAGGHKDIVELLLPIKKCDISLANKYGLTLLHLASLKGYEEIVIFLLQALDEESIYQTCLGKNAFDYAIEGKQAKIIELFLKKAVFNELYLEPSALTLIIEKLQMIATIAIDKDHKATAKIIEWLSEQLCRNTPLCKLERSLVETLTKLKKELAIQPYKGGLKQLGLFKASLLTEKIAEKTIEIPDIMP